MRARVRVRPKLRPVAKGFLPGYDCGVTQVTMEPWVRWFMDALAERLDSKLRQ